MNEFIGIGNLVREPEMAYTTSGTAKCVFTIAINRPKRNGEEQGADYPRIIAWSKLAETCQRYLHKGSKVAVRGSIRTGSYTNKEGAKVYTTDIWAENVEFLGGGQNANNGGAQNNSQPQNFEPAQQPQNFAPANPQARQQDFAGYIPQGFNDMPDSFSSAEDDIPF